jgi:hypothetical protein
VANIIPAGIERRKKMERINILYEGDILAMEAKLELASKDLCALMYYRCTTP